MRPTRRLAAASAAFLIAGVGALVGVSASTASTASAASAVASAPTPGPAPGLRPIIFVHGVLGSGSQFETQAQRFASNGYPANYIEANDYDSLFVNNSLQQVYAALDQRIARMKAATGASQVDLAGHSLGTVVLQSYLNSSAQRAANVAHYVNIDGTGAKALPGGVPTLAIDGEGNTATITGATNISLPDQSHVQTTSSAESFEAEYTFLTGKKPATTKVLPQSGSIKLAGKAVSFPDNVTLRNDAKVRVYPVNPANGHRLVTSPIATFPVSTGDGSFGPFTASPTAYYEFEVSDSTAKEAHHIYYQPFARTDLDIRLLSQNPGAGIDTQLVHNAKSVTALVYRNKEFWGDQGAGSDTLTINGIGVLNDKTAPRSRRTIGLFAFDAGADGVSHLTTTPGVFGALPFISATDDYIAASPTAGGAVTFASVQRGGDGHADTVATPNWPSDKNIITVNFHDYVNN